MLSNSMTSICWATRHGTVKAAKWHQIVLLMFCAKRQRRVSCCYMMHDMEQKRKCASITLDQTK